MQTVLRHTRTIFLSLSLLMPATALAEMLEEVVVLSSQGQDFVGTLALPAGEPAPVVLLLHGFTGSRDELAIPDTEDGVFSRTARLLGEAGYASLRIDFRGSGESVADLSFADTTFEGQIADALAAAQWLSGDARVDGENLLMIGWSQGGLVASAVAGRSDAFDAVALWAAVADPQATYTSILGEEAMATGHAAEAATSVPVTLPWGLEIELKGSFFDGIDSADPEAEIAAYHGPLFVAQGALDTIVDPASADLLIAAHEGPEIFWPAEMDHVFNIFTETETLDNMVADTIAFFDNPPG